MRDVSCRSIKLASTVIPPILMLGIFTALFHFRRLDDNRLTSWGDTFGSVFPASVLLIMIAGFSIAYLLSRGSLIERHPVPLLFVSSYSVASLFWGEPELILDASRYFTQAKHLEVFGTGYFFGEWGRNISAWTDMPLVPFLYGLIFSFFGESRMYIQIVTTLFYSLTTVLTYLIGKAVWNERLGLYAGILLFGVPYLYSQVPLMLVDVPLMFFLALSVLTFIESLKKGGLFIFAAAVSIFLTFCTKYSASLMLTVLVPVFAVHLVTNADDRGRATWRGATVFLLATLFIGGFIIYKFDVVSEQLRLLLTYQKPGLRRWGESFFSTFFFQIHPLITVSALYSIYAAVRKKDLKYLIIFWLLLIVVIFQIKRIRYIIMVFPMLCLMASYGLMFLRERLEVLYVSLCIGISSIIIAVFVYLPFLDRISLVNLKNAGVFLDSLPAGDIEVFTVRQESGVANTAVSVPLLDLFTSKNIRYNYLHDMPAPSEETLRSPLRFTWEYKNPAYYASEEFRRDESAVAVITGSVKEELPGDVLDAVKGYENSTRFQLSENIFDYKTFLTVYYE